MKKIICMLLCFVTVLGVLTACSKVDLNYGVSSEVQTTDEDT